MAKQPELNYVALRQLAEERAKRNAELMWPSDSPIERRKTFNELANRYYGEYTTPPKER